MTTTPRRLALTALRHLWRRWVFSAFAANRHAIASTYIRGEGIEIGALHQPLRLPRGAKVRYVDRQSTKELARHYPEADTKRIVSVDIVDDGERLARVADCSQDFVIANHFLEHCQDPIGAIKNMLRVLRAGGVLYLAVPDKRYSFDADRPVTSLDHLLRDHNQGPEDSRRAHVEEWVRLVLKCDDAEIAEKEIERLIETDYSIHYHVWTPTEIIELVLFLKKMLYFEVEIMFRDEGEVVFVLKKETRESLTTNRARWTPSTGWSSIR
jgi:SAM-dependent methyltransferase